jgi:ribosomal protein L17
MTYFTPTGAQSQNATDLVRNLKSQGMDNNQIIQTLQKQGFSSSSIFDAMNQSDLGLPEPVPVPDPNFQNYQAPQSVQYPVFSQAPETISIKQRGYGDTSNEELIEAVVEEKWNDLIKDLNKIIEWKNATSNKIAMMEQKMEDMRREFDKLHGAVIAKVDDYDKNILNVGAEVRAMEKVFSKVLPAFAENVAELARVAKEIRRPGTK